MDSILNLIDSKLDHVLQKIVDEASAISGFPISLVSLVMADIQFFKAHVGLPPELAVSRATDRCSSLCQFVVETKKPFFIEDASKHPELPQELLKLYNIVSYFGFPITVSGEVVGSLCLIDVKKNSIPKGIIPRMLELAQQVGQHLQTLKKGHGIEALLLEKASAPAMGEIRNILSLLKQTSEQAAYSSHQISPIFFLLEQHANKKLSTEEFFRAMEALQETVKAYKKIPILLNTIQKGVTRVTSAMSGLEGALSLKAGSSSCRMADLLNRSENLSYHLTKLMGGVSWAPLKERYHLDIPQHFAITLLSSILTSIAESSLRLNLGKSGIQGRTFQQKNGQVRIQLTVQNMPPHEWTTLQSILSILAGGSAAVTLETNEEGLAIDWKIAS